MDKTVSIHEAKTYLSRLLNDLKPGDQIILAKMGKPIAKIVPLEAQTDERPWALCRVESPRPSSSLYPKMSSRPGKIPSFSALGLEDDGRFCHRSSGKAPPLIRSSHSVAAMLGP
jgi:antitoxin (DNA-binding transcriptional repressor) of toxin-antitoxin stability system